MFSNYRKTAVLVLVLTLVAAVVGFADYNRDHVVQVMRGNLSLMGEIGKSANASDWVLTAQKLFALAEGMVGIKQYDPPRGSKADWDATIEEFVLTAYRGIGACGAKDATALQEAIARLRSLNGQGHGAHK